VQSVAPAYAKLLPFVRDEYIPGADGAGRGGASRRTGLLPREDPRVHDSRFDPGTDPPDRPREVARIDADMQATMKSTGWKGDFPGFLVFLKTDPQFYAKTLMNS